MADALILEVERAETYERAVSRFEQQWSKTGSPDDWTFSYSANHVENGFRYFDISHTAWQFGIHMHVYISNSLYTRMIKNGKQNPVKNIETLCHAFSYAVDCDANNKRILEFTVPGNGTAPYVACAYLSTAEKDAIIIELVIT